jgi:hypothetical protein
MKAIRINKFVKVSPKLDLSSNSENGQLADFSQDYDEIRVSEVTKPQPKEGEVVVRVIAAGVNFVDLLYVSLFSQMPSKSQNVNFNHLLPRLLSPF